jgi:FAD/FMN-containing dehydrogenase
MPGISAVSRDGKRTIDLSEEILSAFSTALRGRCLTPADSGYEAARIIWNGSADKRPAIIARCSGVADVIDAVNFARKHDLLVAVRGGGHNVAGNAVCDGGIVIDLSAMNGVHVDPAARRVRVAGGATLGDVDRETQAFGLAAPLGVVSLTGIAGLTLCGGLGWLRRKYGMTCDALISVDVVTAEGDFVTANADENSDLFWAVRGGGGNFGVVTSFEFRLERVGPTVNLCAAFYRLDDDAADIVSRWIDFMAAASEDISSTCAFWSVQQHPAFPEGLLGTPFVLIAAVHSGALAAGESLLRPLCELSEPILDLSGQVPFAGVQTAFDPLFVKGERLNYWKSLYLNRIDREAIDRIVARARSRPHPWSLIALWHLGGAMNRVDPSETALGVRDASYLYSLDTSWTDHADDERAIAWTRDAWAELQDYSNGGAYLNFPGQGEEGETLLRASYGSDNYDRLVEIKNKYDPTNLFRMNQNIRPKTEPFATRRTVRGGEGEMEHGLLAR